MLNLEDYGFVELTWEGETLLSPEMEPFVPYWAAFKDGSFISPVIWHSGYQSHKGSNRLSSGILPLEDFDIDLLRDGTWRWDYSIETDLHGNVTSFPHPDWTHIKRIESPFPEGLRQTYY